MKIEADGLGRRGVAFTFATEIAEADVFATTVSETDKGDGLNLRPHE